MANGDDLDPVVTPQNYAAPPIPIQHAVQALMGGAYGVGQQLASLPQRMFQASEQLRTTGQGQPGSQYDPGPAAETMQWLAGGGMPAAERGAAGAFGGILAQHAPAAKLMKAQQMIAKGADPAEVWATTGWERGVGDKWRFEIPDTGASIPRGPEVLQRASEQTLGDVLRGKEQTLGDYLQHEQLYYHYPELAQRPVFNAPEDYAGMYGPETGEFLFNKLMFTPGYNDPIHNALHEVQHGIQHIEGFPRGTNIPESQRLTIQALNKAGLSDDPAVREMFEPLRQHTYARFAGEQEAENVERRAAYAPAARYLRPPWRTETVPRADQIVRYTKIPPPESRYMINALTK